MRREQHVLHVPQRTVRRKRFGLEHIECGAAEVAVLQSRHQIVRPRQIYIGKTPVETAGVMENREPLLQ